MALYEVKPGARQAIEETTFAAGNIRDRGDLHLLRRQIDIVAPGCLVVAAEFGDWADSSRRIDLLAIDRAANLVVIELKRIEGRELPGVVLVARRAGVE